MMAMVCCVIIVACKGVRAAFLVGGMPRRPGMTRQDLLSANAYVPFYIPCSARHTYIDHIDVI